MILNITLSYAQEQRWLIDHGVRISPGEVMPELGELNSSLSWTVAVEDMPT